MPACLAVLDEIQEVIERPHHFKTASFHIMFVPEIKQDGLALCDGFLPVYPGQCRPEHRPHARVKREDGDLVQEGFNATAAQFSIHTTQIT